MGGAAARESRELGENGEMGVGGMKKHHLSADFMDFWNLAVCRIKGLF